MGVPRDASDIGTWALTVLMPGSGNTKKPKPLFRAPEKRRVRCLGYYCWLKEKTFVSPDPKRIRLCGKCQAYAGGIRETTARATYRKSVKGENDG